MRVRTHLRASILEHAQVKRGPSLIYSGLDRIIEELISPEEDARRQLAKKKRISLNLIQSCKDSYFKKMLDD